MPLRTGPETPPLYSAFALLVVGFGILSFTVPSLESVPVKLVILVLPQAYSPLTGKIGTGLAGAVKSQPRLAFSNSNSVIGLKAAQSA